MLKVNYFYNKNVLTFCARFDKIICLGNMTQAIFKSFNQKLHKFFFYISKNQILIINLKKVINKNIIRG